MTCSTNIFTPLYHFSKQNETMPLWRDKSAWELFLEGYCEFMRRDFSESINEHLNDSDKKLNDAICERILIVTIASVVYRIMIILI